MIKIKHGDLVQHDAAIVAGFPAVFATVTDTVYPKVVEVVPSTDDNKISRKIGLGYYIKNEDLAKDTAYLINRAPRMLGRPAIKTVDVKLAQCMQGLAVTKVDSMSNVVAESSEITPGYLFVVPPTLWAEAKKLLTPEEFVVMPELLVGGNQVDRSTWYKVPTENKAFKAAISDEVEYKSEYTDEKAFFAVERQMGVVCVNPATVQKFQEPSA